MKKTMKKKCEETTTVTLYIKHALFGCIKWSWNGVQIVLPLFNLVSQKQHIFIYDQPVRLPCLDQKIGPKLSDITTVTPPTSFWSPVLKPWDEHFQYPTWLKTSIKFSQGLLQKVPLIYVHKSCFFFKRNVFIWENFKGTEGIKSSFF